MGKTLQTILPKNKGGRPIKTLKDYLPKGWQQIVFEMSAEGCSDVEIRAHFIWDGHTKTFNHKAWDALMERDQEFSATIQRAKVLCQAWWEKVSRVSLHDKDFQTGSWYSNMKNRFGWRDKVDIDYGITKEAQDMLDKYESIDIHAFRDRLGSSLGQNN